MDALPLLLIIGCQAVQLSMAGGPPPSRCAEVIADNEDYLRCMQGFSSMFSNMAALGPSNQNATVSVFCSAEGKAALGCVLKYFKMCPELAFGSDDSGGMYDTISVIQIAGAVEVYCDVLEEGCMSTFIDCTAPLNPQRGGGDIFMKALPSDKDTQLGPTFYSTIPAQIGILCGPMEEIMTCAVDAYDKCPGTSIHTEQILSFKISAQRENGWPDFPTYSEAKRYIKGKCPSLPSDLNSKRPCLEASVNQTDFVDCVTNTTYDQKTECSEYSRGKMCVMKHVEPDCGKDYAEVLVDSSHLFSEDIPSQCEAQVAGVNRMQASLLTLIVTGCLLMLWNF